jgi:hypothetical protein
MGEKDFDLDLKTEDPELLSLLSTENDLIESIEDLKSGFKGVAGEEEAPRWATLDNLRHDISGYASGKFSTNLDLDEKH